MGGSSYRGLELPGFNGTCNLSLRPLLKLTLAATFSVICALYGLSKKHTGHKSSACRAWQSQQDLAQ